MRKSLILVLIVLAPISCSGEISMEKKIDSIFEEFNSISTPGVSVAVLKDGISIYQKGIGLVDLDIKATIEPKTNFRLASITKQFTALSIMLLENDGKLSFNDHISKFFPELPKYGDKISIKNILQHTSGLLDYENYISDTATVQLKDKDVLQILIDQDSTYFDAGVEHRYSNSGYAVLANLVEKLSGLSFAEFLQTRIFEPLKMENSVAYEKGISEVPNRSFGYANTDSGFVYSDQSLTSAVIGDGGIYSSTIDLIKWDKEVNSPTLLSKEKFDQVFKKGINDNGEEFDYGFGWRLDPYKGYYRPYHTGSTCGFSNIYMKLPELELTIIVLINIRDYDAKDYAERIADLFIN
jgi:CubicO group peptidase (beta-lactamase class C family)